MSAFSTISFKIMVSGAGCTPLTVNTVALTGGVGGILGLIIVSESVVIAILLCMLKWRSQSK